MSKKPLSISYSSSTDYKECPVKYFLKKKWETSRKASALFYGSAVEEGVTALLEGSPIEEAVQKFQKEWTNRPAGRWSQETPIFDSPDVFYYKSDLDMKLFQKEHEDIIKEWSLEICATDDYMMVVEEALSCIDKGIQMPPAIEKLYHRICWLSCAIRGEILLKAFQEQVLPEIEEVIASQKEIEIQGDDGDKVRGFIDFILKLKGIDEPVVIDLKTAGRPYTEHNLDTSDQLKIYAMAEGRKNIGYIVLLKSIKFDTFCDKCGHKRENYRLTNCAKCGNMDKGKYTVKSPKASTQILTKKVEQAELESMADDLGDIMVAIKNEIKWKNPSSCNNYNTPCEFYQHCWSGKKLEDLPNITKKEQK